MCRPVVTPARIGGVYGLEFFYSGWTSPDQPGTQYCSTWNETSVVSTWNTRKSAVWEKSSPLQIRKAASEKQRPPSTLAPLSLRPICGPFSSTWIPNPMQPPGLEFAKDPIHGLLITLWSMVKPSHQCYSPQN